VSDAGSLSQELDGSEGRIHASVWPNPRARCVVVLAHGYGEHIGRYDHVAQRLLAAGAAVWGLDHLGHGRSAGERALVTDFERVVDDLRQLVALARPAHPGLPVVLIGHSMGGMIAARYAQRFGNELAGLVLSGPAIGGLETVEQLLALPEIPPAPIDPAVLSRDAAVGAAYVADPLVYHGGFKRPTVAAMRAVLLAIQSGPGFGALPTLWVHGSDDRLVPLAATRNGLAKLRGSDFTERIYAGARHEVFNETNRDEVLDDVCRFLERVTRR